MRADDRGSVTAFVVTLTLALLLAAGLVFDGGRLVAGRTAAADAAENAARAGAQEITGIRSGAFRVDPARATARAEAYLSAVGASGSVAVDGRSVTVSVTTSIEVNLLGLLGLGRRSVTVTRTVEAVDR